MSERDKISNQYNELIDKHQKYVKENEETLYTNAKESCTIKKQLNESIMEIDSLRAYVESLKMQLREQTIQTNEASHNLKLLESKMFKEADNKKFGHQSNGATKDDPLNQTIIEYKTKQPLLFKSFEGMHEKKLNITQSGKTTETPLKSNSEQKKFMQSKYRQNISSIGDMLKWSNANDAIDTREYEISTNRKKSIEKELSELIDKKKSMDSEFVKLASKSKSYAIKKRKDEIEHDIDAVDVEIVSLKQKLRKSIH